MILSIERGPTVLVKARGRRIRLLVTVSSLLLSALTISSTTAASNPAGASSDAPSVQVQTNGDVSWTLASSDDGLVLYTSSNGTTWHARSRLNVPGVTSRQWIGQGCLLRGSRQLAVAFGPVEAISSPAGFEAGAFVGLVDLDSGAVTLTSTRATYAYFSPACGADGRAQLTSFGEAESTTSVTSVDGSGAVTTLLQRQTGEYTSAVARADGSLVAAHGDEIVSFEPGAASQVLAQADGTISGLHVTQDGALVYQTGSGDEGQVQRFAEGRLSVLAPRAPGEVAIDDIGNGVLAIHGTNAAALPIDAPNVHAVSVPADAEPSMLGRSWTTPTVVDAALGGTAVVTPSTGGQGSTVTLPPAQSPTTPTTTAGVKHSAPRAGPATLTSSTTDDNLPCAVKRNDVRTQAYQPSVDQVEWAVDQGVRGRLATYRPAGYRQFGLPSYRAQQMFPLPAIRGGGSVPPQVMLGILANESNLWQASSHVSSGGYGNPLTGNIYGRADSALTIDFSRSDCGYGIGQVTDGMRTGQQSATQQRAIALDYQVNIAQSLSILISKWNQLTDLPTPIKMNDGRPQYLENWYAAIWAYNTGIQPNAANGNTTGCTPSPTCTDAKGYWGLGWANNPANPVYDPGRTMFNSLPSDAARPGRWPYQERVLGWAAYPIFKAGQSSYTQAWWINDDQRRAAVPSPSLFCTSRNGCSGASLTSQGECGRSDFHCWTNYSVSWKTCSDNTCGHSPLYYSSAAPEPPDPASADPAVCSSEGLPSGAVIVDDVSTPTPVAGTPCSPIPTVGSFGFEFTPDANGNYPAHIDLHQVNGGLNGHYWFTHTALAPGRLAATGTWSFPASTTGWGDVYVHVPALGAQTSQAHFQVVDGATGAISDRWISEYWGTNHWFKLGAYKFTAREEVKAFSVSNHASGSADVAWDAVAFAPRPTAPYGVAILGDSYTAGEGLEPYTNDSDNQADGEPNACHRSPQAYGSLFRLPGSGVSASQRSDVDLRIAACSGARTTSLTSDSIAAPGGEVPHDSGWGGNRYEHGEAMQVSDVSSLPAISGALSPSTSLVALTIGGNDARFAGVIKYCTLNVKNCNADGQIMSGDPLPLNHYEPHVLRDLLPSHLAATYARVHREAPNAKMYVLGYPRLFDTTSGSACGTLSLTERKWLNSQGDILNKTISDTVAELRSQGTKIWFVPTTSRFAGHGVCSADEWINGRINDSDSGSGYSIPGSGSFHPKPAGQQAMADALTEAIAVHGS